MLHRLTPRAVQGALAIGMQATVIQMLVILLKQANRLDEAVLGQLEDTMCSQVRPAAPKLPRAAG